jgi:hypothetical protein
MGLFVPDVERRASTAGRYPRTGTGHSESRLGRDTMTKQLQDAQDKDNEGRAQKVVEDLIGAQVIQNLGKPGGFREVQVRHLWENRFRVNLLVGGDAISARFAHSYFLVIDDDGLILASTPEITRQY